MAHIDRLIALSTVLAVLAMLTGCASAPATQAPAAPPLDFAQRHQLQLQVSPYVDLMPRASLGTEEPTCANLIVLFSIRAGADGFPPGLEVGSVRLTKLGAAGMGARELLYDRIALTDHTAPPFWAETRFSGHVVDAKVRETYFIKTLTSATNWSSSRAVAPGELPPQGWSWEHTFRGAATGCPPWGWDSGDTLEVVLQIKSDGQTATVRAVGLYSAVS